MKHLISALLLIYLSPFATLAAEEESLFIEYVSDPVTQQITAELTSIDNHIVQRKFFAYDDDGRIVNMITDDGSGDAVDILDEIERRYITTFSYMSTEATCQQLKSIQEEVYCHLDGELQCVKCVTSYADDIKKSSKSKRTHLSQSTAQTQRLREQELSFTSYMHDHWDKFLHKVFSKNYLQMAGYYQGETSIGSFKPEQEIDSKVRISLINGILCISSDMEELLTQFSETHGNTAIHYVFRPTEGWTKDLFSCAFVKIGIISEPARQLVVLWRRLIEEVGGIDGEGYILHYAHSIGATDTFKAIKMLTPEEQSLIHVVTFGSPTMIPSDSGFASVVNYVSKRDGVCLFDPVGYVKGWTQKESNVCFLGTFKGVPFIDHVLQGSCYAEIIEQLGANFVMKHGQ